MKIIKIKKALENCQLKDLEDGDSMGQDFEIITEPEGDEPEQKYLGKLIITKIPEEETRKTKRKFAIKKITDK